MAESPLKRIEIPINSLLGSTNRFTHGVELQSDGIFSTCLNEIAGWPVFMVNTRTPLTMPSRTNTTVAMCVAGAKCSLLRSLFSVTI